MSPMEVVEANLDSLGGGAIKELFEYELSKVVRNIEDRNAQAEAKRTVTMTVTFEPDKDREEVGVTVNVKSKLAGPENIGATMFVGRERGELRALTMKADSLGLFTEPAPKVVEISANDGESFRTGEAPPTEEADGPDA